MSSRPIERSGRSFSLRLNLWYAAFFIFGCFALFLLAYFVLASFIQQKEKEVIRDRNWVSSRKPDDLPAFNRESIRLISELHPAKAMQPHERDSLGVRS